MRMGIMVLGRNIFMMLVLMIGVIGVGQAINPQNLLKKINGER